MNRTRTMMWLSVLLLLVGLLTGCEAGSVEIGMVETHRAGEWRAAYTTFSGTKSDTFQAKAGQTLMLEYDAQVEKGVLYIQLESPDDEVVWQVSLQTNDADALQIALGQEGRYALRIHGEDTGGGWDMTWDIQ